METHYTQNFLLKYLYNETSLTQKLEIENAISTDEETNKEFQILRSGYKKLPKAKFYPADTVMNKILNYSSRTMALDPSF